jgi:hypothetical protein
MNQLFLKDFDSDEEDEEYIPDKKELEEDLPKFEIKKEVNMSKIDDIWSKLKNKNKITENTTAVGKSQLVEVNSNLINHSNQNTQKKEDDKIENKTDQNISEESNPKPENKISSLDEEIQRAIQKSKEAKNKLTTETVHFAGQKFEYQKVVTEEDLKKQQLKDKKKTHSGLDSLVEQLEKKNNLNTYTKTKKDWTNYVEEKKIEKELDFNRKDGFLSKKQFIEETNYKIIENMKSTKRQKKD